MNQRKLLTMSVGLICFSSLCMANPSAPSTKQKGEEEITLVRTGNGAKAGRPKAPDRQVITCTYDGYGMDLNFTFSEGMGVLTVTDENLQGLVYNIDTSLLDVYVPVGNLAGAINIELETENGNVYEGEIKQ